jgi:hypothetical protein
MFIVRYSFVFVTLFVMHYYITNINILAAAGERGAVLIQNNNSKIKPVLR